MKNVLVLLPGLVLACLPVSAQIMQKPPAQVQQTIKTLQARALANYKPANFPEIFGGVGPKIMGSVKADQVTGEIWWVAMRHKHEDDLRNPWIGFLSSPLQNVGTVEWPGVTMTAAIQVTQVHGTVTFIIRVVEGNGWGYDGVQDISAPGTYEVTSLPFSMKPNISYNGRAYICGRSDGPTNEALGCYARITSIRFNFP